MSAFVDTSVWFAALGTNIFGRHQPGIMTKRCEFAAQVMCTDAGFHADEAKVCWRAALPLGQRDHFCPQHDGAACIVAYDVEPILGDIDSDHGDRGIGCLAHGDLHVLVAPGQLIAGGAGARPDHLISRSDSLAASLLLRHT